MAKIDDLYSMLRDHGIPAIDKRVPGRPGSFNPKFFVVHHTASRAGSGDVPCLNICRYGRSDVPGPLCQILLGRAGTVIVISDGRANHPGRCDRDMVERAEQGLAPNRRPGGDDSGVNAAGRAYGCEAENNGLGEPWPNVQLDMYLALCEAFAKEMGWGSGHFWGHKEITRRKIDPSFDMNWFRSELGKRLDGKDWFDMASQEDLENIVNGAVAPLATDLAAVKAELETVKANQSQFHKDTRVHLSGTTVRKAGDNKQYLLIATPEGLRKRHVSASELSLLQKAGVVGTEDIWNLRVVEGADADALDAVPEA